MSKLPVTRQGMISLKYLKLYGFLLLLIVLVTAMLKSYGNNDSEVSPNDRAVEYNISPKAFYVTLPEEISLPEILNQSVDNSRFNPISSESIKLGYVKENVWVRFSYSITQPLKEEIYLSIPYARINQLELFVLNQDKRLSYRSQSGMEVPIFQREVMSSDFYLSLGVNQPGNYEVYLRISSIHPLNFPIYIASKSITLKSAFINNMILIGYFGFMLALIFYNGFLYFSLKDKNYLLYIGYVGCIGGFLFSHYGLHSLYTDNAWWINSSISIFVFLISIFAIQFIRYFLQLNEKAKYADLWLKGWLILSLAMLPIILISPVYPFYVAVVITISGLAISLSCASISAYQWYLGNSIAKYYFLAWGALFVSVFAQLAIHYSLLPNITVFHWSMLIGTAAESLLLSFALAYRINILRQEKMQSIQEATEARAAINARTEFLAKMSHEIRTPMNGVLGMTELLRSTKLEPLQKHYADVIYNSGNALLDVINDILDFSALETGKIKLENISFNLEKIIEECIAVFTSTARDKNIELISNIKPGTPTLLRGDPTRFRQIIINLMSNAFKFTDEGNVIVTVSCQENLPNENRVKLRVEVEDTGVGISASNQAKLFKSFSQADETMTRKYGGTGLGLFIAQRLVKLMHGEISLASVLHQGTRVWFTVQFEFAEKNALSQQDSAQSRVQLNNKLLLIIDDCAAFAEVIAEQARSWKMHPFVAKTGKEALSLLAESKANHTLFDGIVLDIRLPDISGLDIAEMLTKDPLLKKIPILLVTAMHHVIDTLSLEELGIKIALEKPISSMQLREAILQLFSEKAKEAKKVTHQNKTDALSKLHILIAEDNSINQLVIKGMLHKLGVNSTIVNNGIQVVEKIKENSTQFNLILMDCEMPELDGYRATKQIRDFENGQRLKPIPIIALTAHATEKHKEKSIQSGMNDHITKPITIGQLKKTLTDWAAQNSLLQQDKKIDY